MIACLPCACIASAYDCDIINSLLVPLLFECVACAQQCVTSSWSWCMGRWLYRYLMAVQPNAGRNFLVATS